MIFPPLGICSREIPKYIYKKGWNGAFYCMSLFYVIYIIHNIIYVSVINIYEST